MLEKSEIYDTICIPVRNIHCYDECSVLNDSEYTNFKNAVIDNLNLNDVKKQNKYVKSIQDVFHSWYDTIN